MAPVASRGQARTGREGGYRDRVRPGPSWRQQQARGGKERRQGRGRRLRHSALCSRFQRRSQPGLALSSAPGRGAEGARSGRGQEPRGPPRTSEVWRGASLAGERRAVGLPYGDTGRGARLRGAPKRGGQGTGVRRGGHGLLSAAESPPLALLQEPPCCPARHRLAPSSLRPSAHIHPAVCPQPAPPPGGQS